MQLRFSHRVSVVFRYILQLEFLVEDLYILDKIPYAHVKDRADCHKGLKKIEYN